MLQEPEFSIVAAWYAAGNAPRVVPFGVSGHACTFQDRARKLGAWGSFKRYGALHIDADAMPYIAGGLITAAEARAGFVWALLKERGPMKLDDLAVAMHLSRRIVADVRDAMLKIEAVEFVPLARAMALKAVDMPRPPHWSDYLSEQQAKAA